MAKTKKAPDKTAKKARKSKKLPKGVVRISKAAAAAVVSRQTVEYYILIGLVKPIRKERGRFFDSKLIRRIRLIRQLNDKEYTLRAIRETFGGKRLAKSD